MILPDDQVLVSRTGEPNDISHRETLIWQPPEMPAPLTVDLRVIFADLR